MADVRVTENHTLGAAGARAKLGAFEEMLAKYRVKLDWRGNAAKLKGTGVSGKVDVTETNCSVEIKLGMMAKAIGVDAERLEASVRKRLRAAFDVE
jgi:putative polyhydroxyalkanoate system protein